MTQKGKKKKRRKSHNMSLNVRISNRLVGPQGMHAGVPAKREGVKRPYNVVVKVG